MDYYYREGILGTLGVEKYESLFPIGGIIVSIIVFIPALGEEVFYRGFVYNLIDVKIGANKVLSILISTTIFSLGHLKNLLNVIQGYWTYKDLFTNVLFAFFGGFFFTTIYAYGKKVYFLLR